MIEQIAQANPVVMAGDLVVIGQPLEPRLFLLALGDDADNTNGAAGKGTIRTPLPFDDTVILDPTESAGVFAQAIFDFVGRPVAVWVFLQTGENGKVSAVYPANIGGSRGYIRGLIKTQHVVCV